MATNDTRGPTCTILSGASLSDAVFLQNDSPCQIEMPGTWTAASLSFETSFDGTTYTPANTVSSALAMVEYSITGPAASKTITLDPAVFCASRYIKIRSGTSAAPVNQGADRSLRVICRPV